VTNVLTNLVAFSSGKDGTLPGGYVPLPSDLATQATLDIAKDIKAAAAGTSGSTGSSGSGSTGSGSSSSSGGVPATQDVSGGSDSSGDGLLLGTGSTGEVFGTGVTAAAGTPNPAAPAPAKTPPTKPTVHQNVIAADFNVVVGGARLVIPVLVALAAAAFIAGPAMLAWPRRRRRRPVPGAASPEGRET
jgi:hypothetical protein